ncbi:MAG TPA: c-type cytochrome, partial [Pirellulaceae bacterium]|nr:c-type cytochrome [Pirellulaceae bacterium]
LSNEQLLAEPRSRMVAIEMLYRPGLRDEHRREAVRELAKVDGKTELQIVMDAIHALDRRATGVDVGVVFDLVRQLTGRRAAELASARAELEKLATSAKQAIFRQIGFVSLISVDGGVDKAWGLATSDPARLVDFVNAVPMISDASVRAGVFDQILPLLKQLPAPLHDKVSDRKGTYGRYVRIELPRRGTLTLAEVEVISGGDNVARRGRATQKNTAHGGDASRAIDGKRSGSYGDGGQTHTEEETTNPFWEVDLTDELPIDQIAVFNRTDADLGNRLDGFTIQVLDGARGEVWKQEKVAAPKPSVQFQLEGGGPVALVRRAAMNALTTMRGQETTVFAALAPFVKDDTERAYAVRALQRLPKATWPADQAPELIATLTAAVRKTPVKDRTSPTALDALEFADALAGLLPADAAKKSRAELAELGVRVIRIGTVFERMSYDKEVIVVRAGKPVEFILDNNDLMPHNLAITLPGALEEIGLLGEATAQQPSAGERGYIPQSSKILLASRLLQPRESQKLSFVAPREPGVYPYVCTYPGHWRRMYGAMYVVEDLDEYQANPEAYLAANKIDVKDALLKDRRPRTQWKFEDLADIMKEMSEHGGRNFGNGKQLFTVASCVACHKLGGVGNEIGPDLAKLDEKWQPLDIVKEILDPSLKINEKYQTYVFELNSGKTITGLILEEKPDQVKVIENPLAKTPPVVIKKSDIAERTKSPTSLMPKGLLDKLTRDEILDLIAYLAARGDKSHALFGGDGHDHHKH